MQPEISLEFLSSLPAALAGGAIALVALVQIHRVTAQAQPPSRASERLRPLHLWPLLIIWMVYVGMAGLELLVGRFPEVLPILSGQSELRLAAAPWEREARWTYELRNILDEPVGEAICQVQPTSEEVRLDCELHQEAFEAQADRSYFNLDEQHHRQQAVWSLPDLELLHLNAWLQTGDTQTNATVQQGEAGMVLSLQDAEGIEVLELSGHPVVVAYEWPWRFSAVPFREILAGRVMLAQPIIWREDTQSAGPAQERVWAKMQGAEPLATPAGRFIAWRVALGDETAWYNVDPPYTLLQYDDGTVTWVLTENE
jgi:hypothetical protein